MKFYPLLFLLIITCQTGSFAQTKIIAHKSHGSTIYNFKLAIQNDIFDLNVSQLFLPNHCRRKYTLVIINILSTNINAAKAIFVHSKLFIRFTPKK